jgi:hypothetical protein
VVITALQGGLGNQLFQYAMGLATALRRETGLKLDVRAYRGGTRARLRSALRLADPARGRSNRAFALDKWNIDVRLASLSEVEAVRLYDRVICTARPKIPYFARPVVRQQVHGFDPALLAAPRNCLLVGFWQSEKFFAGIECRLRHEFTLRRPPGPHAEAMASFIRGAEQSVFLHVRRGDYVSNENFEVCSLAYYRAAISYLERHVERPHFFIFSDDPEWACRHLVLNERFTLATGAERPNAVPTGYEHEDLWLMGLCRHGIISNSSFSWWGAWLNAGKEGVVVAPSLWQQKPACDSRVFIPEQWVCIDA